MTQQIIDNKTVETLFPNNANKTEPHTTRLAKKVNNLSQKYEIRRPHFEGKKEASCSLIVPAKFVDCIGLVKGDYVKLYVDNNKIWMERIANQIEGNGGQFGNK